MHKQQLAAKIAIDFIYDIQLQKPTLKLRAKKNNRERTKAQLFFVGSREKELYIVVGNHVDALSSRILIEHPLTIAIHGVNSAPNASPYKGSPVKNAATGRRISIQNQHTVYVETTDALAKLLAWYSDSEESNEESSEPALYGKATEPSSSNSSKDSASLTLGDEQRESMGSGSNITMPESPTPTEGDDSVSLKDVDQLGGTGYEPDPKIRKVVELHAVAKATAFYKERGYSVTEKGKPYDLLCEKFGEVVHVEVKGSRNALDAIIVTTNEVGDARNADWKSDLFLVDKIVLEPDDETGYVPSGGRCRLANAWWPEDQDLTPIQYRYKLPSVPDAE